MSSYQIQTDLSYIDSQLRELQIETQSGPFWLHEGANYFGSNPANRIVFPFDGVAPFAGIFFLRNDTVLMRVASSVVIAHEKKPVDNILIYHESIALVLTYGELRFRIIKENGRYAVSFMTLES
jgi:hypothetical protein